MNRVTQARIAAIAFAASLPAQVQAGPIGIQMMVPVFCQAAILPSGAPQEGTVRNVGILREACNNETGYTVVIQHPSGLHDVFFLLSGDHGAERIPLSDSGFTILTQSNEPSRKTRQLSLEVDNPGEQIPWISVSTIIG